MYWAVYDQTKDKIITPAVWDLDISMGAKSALQYNEDFISPEYDTGDILYLITRLKNLNVDNFNDGIPSGSITNINNGSNNYRRAGNNA